MILDKGMCTVFRPTDASEPGRMPVVTYAPLFCGWYGELSYSTSPAREKEGRTEHQIDGRIRILQCRSIRQNDVVLLEACDDYSKRSAGAVVYRIVRAWHGADEDSPDLISDLSLEVVQP